MGAAQKVVFEPYTKQQLAAILRQRLEQLPGPVFEPHALALCAAKVCTRLACCSRVLCRAHRVSSS